jgi:hypothetical protein
MAGKTANTALQTAIQGGKVSDKAAQSALGKAVERITNLSKKASTSKEAMIETGTLVLHTAETQGSLFLASLAEGYFGEDKIKVGPVDLRAPVGLLAQGYGLYQAITGQKGAGQHVLAVGNGVVGSWLANVARNAGRTLAEKRSSNPTSTVAPTSGVPTVPAPVVVMGGAPALPAPPPFYDVGAHEVLLTPEHVAGPVREVLLTPEPTTAGDPEPRRERRGTRFVRAARADDDQND